NSLRSSPGPSPPPFDVARRVPIGTTSHAPTIAQRSALSAQHSLEAPLAPTALAAVERLVAQEAPAKLLVVRAVPDLAQRPLESVAQDRRLAVALHERHEAAGMHAPIGAD